jgi:hypothetical protein
MRSLTVTALVIAGIAMSVPATASPTVSGDTHARAAGPVVQYAQWDPNLYNPKDRESGIIGLGYKSKKSKTSKAKTSGHAKSGTKPQ